MNISIQEIWDKNIKEFVLNKKNQKKLGVLFNMEKCISKLFYNIKHTYFRKILASYEIAQCAKLKIK